MRLFCLITIALIIYSGHDFSAFGQNSYDQIGEKTSNLLRTSSFQEINILQEPYSLQDSVIIKLADNRLIIDNLPKDDVLEIYNIMGVKVYNRRVEAGTNEYIISLQKGYYILKIGKLTKKIVIR